LSRTGYIITYYYREWVHSSLHGQSGTPTTLPVDCWVAQAQFDVNSTQAPFLHHPYIYFGGVNHLWG
jgi:hypothetical protein